ncbi:sugar-binding domain-containing protein [Mycoplasmopsis alligatoris]|uniref:Glycosyl hydrolase family 2, sugar binding domain protein n=1 Tax=Mycoplasmopsis alligatoris A21JP2 TaxID=747682 RepID=D4XW61_9BACT|nr:sugar-binding domain-containing protein [Mycoplasmopsis alligatoris]EFF41415.1 glycosyl hydrolase family 2, sugar binding domain protein [Mycoplasmopsis alligatoris A21JP2]
MKKKIILSIFSIFGLSLSALAIACNKKTEVQNNNDTTVNKNDTSTNALSKREEILYENLDFTKREVEFVDNWKFNYGEKTNAQKKNFDDSDWENVNLPHDFSLNLPYETSKGEAESGFKLGGVGWYRKDFTIPAELKNKRVVINFGGVYNNAEIYINDKKIGEHPYGYTPFAFDLSDYLNYGAQNVIAIKVNHEFPSSRWYSGSGIYRHVTLSILNDLHIGKYGIIARSTKLEEQKDGNVELSVFTTLNNSSNETKKAIVKQTLLDDTGKEVANISSEAVSIDATNSNTITSKLSINKPKLWSVDNPYLYKIKTEVLINNKVVDTKFTDYGFRYFKFDKDQGFSLNGKNMKLKGVSMHHDQGSLGARAYIDATARQIDKLKAMGTNTIRVTHNPASDILIDLANKKGILIIDEAFDTWILPKNGNKFDYSTAFRKEIGSENKIIGKTSDKMTWAEMDMTTMIKRGINSPAAIMWSVGNELMEGTGGDNTKYPSILKEMVGWMTKTDPTRPATIGENHLRHSPWALSYELVNELHKLGGVVGYNYPTDGFFVRDRAKYPDWKIYASESASAVNSRGIYNEKYQGNYSDARTSSKYLTSYDKSRVSWGDTSAQSWEYVLKTDYAAGEMIWTGFDYLGEPTPWNELGRANISDKTPPKSSYFGIIDTAGFPKDRYYFYRSQWIDDKTTLHLLPAWKEEMITKGNNNEVDVVVYTNAHKVKLFKVENGTETELGSKEFTETTTPLGYKLRYYTGNDKSSKSYENLFFTFKVPFFKGKIIAKAYDKNNKEITETDGRKVIEDFGVAKKIITKVTKNKLNANNQDLSYIEMTIVDEQGREVANAANNISVKVEGKGAELAAMDNGLQFDHEPYNSGKRNAFSGKLLAILRATNEPGKSVVTISGEGLETVKIDLETISNQKQNIKSVTMKKNYYYSKGNKLELEKSVLVKTNDGKSIEDEVVWDKYDIKLLEKENSTFSIKGTTKQTKATVSTNINVISTPVAAMNYSTAVLVNDKINLPKTRPVIGPDGQIINIEFPVQWVELDKINTSKPATYQVNGIVKAFNKEYPVQALVRIFQKVEGIGENIARGARLTQNIDSNKHSDNLAAIIDGTENYQVVSGGDNATMWSNYKNAQDKKQDAELTFAFATNASVRRVKIYVYEDSWSAIMPDDLELYYVTNGTVENAKWVKVNVKKTIESPTSQNKPRLIPVILDFDPINILHMKLVIKGKKGNVANQSHFHATALTEVEILRSETSLKLNNTVLPERILLNGEDLNYSDLEKEIELDSNKFELYVQDNSNNVSITTLPEFNGKRTIIFQSEDGQKTSYITFKLKK